MVYGISRRLPTRASMARETHSFKVRVIVTIARGPRCVCLGHPELWKGMKSPEPVSVPGSWPPHRNTHGTDLGARNLCCLYCLGRRCGLCGEDAACAHRPFTSQHEREEGSEEPPAPGAVRNPQEVTCQRVQRGRAMTCPSPPVSQALQAAAPALMGLAEVAIKEHP